MTKAIILSLRLRLASALRKLISAAFISDECAAKHEAAKKKGLKPHLRASLPC